jgi:ribosomal protein L31
MLYNEITASSLVKVNMQVSSSFHPFFNLSTPFKRVKFYLC